MIIMIMDLMCCLVGSQRINKNHQRAMSMKRFSKEEYEGKWKGVRKKRR